MRDDSKLAIDVTDCVLYQFIEDVPEENSLCELDCRKLLCTEREWIICRRRPAGKQGHRGLRAIQTEDLRGLPICLENQRENPTQSPAQPQERSFQCSIHR